ncbi:hypothetical protein R3P38DRAFT_3016914 [Favolaschia claudopus]|uniref:Uncharacterized protein n=1 Tax=Favolaschia claudopus TaxID=2862362 RepID=A0AAW0AJD4_9AGAR
MLTDAMNSSLPPGLGTSEMYWFNRREFLLRQGYRLRPKFNPDFASKYHLLDETAMEECGILYSRPTIMDVVRVSDGTKVMLKSVSTSIHQQSLVFAVEAGSGCRFRPSYVAVCSSAAFA